MPKRNAQGGGTIRQRPDGRWEARYTAGRDAGTGKQIQKSIYGATQKEARQKLQKICNDIDTGIYTAPLKTTVSAWLDIWLNEYTGNVKPFTIKAYQDRVNIHIKPHIGAIQLNTLNTPTIQNMYNTFQKTLAPKTIRNIHGVLHKALEQAVKIGYLYKNPSDMCTLPRLEKKEIKPLDNDDISRFLQAIQGHKYENLYIVDLFTGMRQGEILGLTWDCVDLLQGTILIKQQLQKEKKKGGIYYLSSLKNDKTRKITLAKFVIDSLRKQHQEQLRNCMISGDQWNQGDLPNLVFTNETGGNLSHCTVAKNFKRIVTSLGLPEARFHDMRHSYAVASLQAGDDIKTVQDNLGHHTAAFTLDVYGHVTEQMKKDSAERMNKLIENITG